MNVGVPKEIKKDENRVAITPAGVYAFAQRGHKVFVEDGAGLGSGFSNQDYIGAGSEILLSKKEVYDCSDLVIKVKEPLPEEYGYFKENLIIFTYLHLAPVPDLIKALLDTKVTGIAYETVQLDDGSLPLLNPMSEVAGRMSVQIGAHFLEKRYGGRGVLLGGVPGVPPANVVVIGGGTVGINAARIASGMGAFVTVLDISAPRLRFIDEVFGGKVATLMSSPYNIAEAVKNADLLIGAVLIPGAKCPRLVTEDMVKTMRAGSVIVDVAIDQGGSIETIDRITTHSDPVYEKYGVVHYAVANIPGAVPRTSTFALTNVTLPYALKIADLGAERAMRSDRALAKGLNTYRGKVTYQAVASEYGVPCTPVREVLGE
jgi:alanine dehydrogenase